MRAYELIKETEIVQEIERISPSGFEGGKEHLTRKYNAGKTVKKLPGGSGLLYSIQPDGGEITIRLWDKVNKGEFEPFKKPGRPSYYSNRDYNEVLTRWEKRNAEFQAQFARAPGKLVGELIVSKSYNFPLKNALQVDTITVDEDYRGIGLAKALYGIVLTIMKRPLLAGRSQTPGGRKNWVSISQIPGVEMKGYFGLDNIDFHYTDTSELHPKNSDINWVKRVNRRVNNTIDTIMGQLGGQYIGKHNDRQFFAFDVNPDTTGKELKSHIDTNLTKVYGSYNSDAGLYATWIG